MPTNYPGSIDSYTSKTNNVDTIDASHVNNLQDAMVAVQTALGAGSVTRTSWTPVITFESGTLTSVTYTSANTGGWYSQVGKVVLFTVRFEITAISYGSVPVGPTTWGNLNVSLPAISSHSGNFALSSVPVNTATGWTTAFPMVGRVAASSQVMRLYAYASGTGYTLITSQHTGTPSVGTPLTLLASGFYFTT